MKTFLKFGAIASPLVSLFAQSTTEELAPDTLVVIRDTDTDFEFVEALAFAGYVTSLHLPREILH